jgi:hypothetical protein
VLGFSLLWPHKQRSSIRHAFQSAGRLLAGFGQTSPQARQYHCILNEFADAIDAHERQRQSDQPRRRSSRVEKILSFDVGSSSREGGWFETQRMFPSSPQSGGTNATVDGQSQVEHFLMDDFTRQWDWGPGAGDNEILRMFLDPCLDNLMSYPEGHNFG